MNMKWKALRLIIFLGSLLVIKFALGWNETLSAWAWKNDNVVYENINHNQAIYSGHEGQVGNLPILEEELILKYVPTVSQVIVSPPSPPLIGVDGDKSRIEVQVVGTNDEPVDDGTLVSFEAPAGSFDPIDGLTVGGVVETTYISEAVITGTITITAIAGGKSGTTQIEISDQVSSQDVLAVSASTFPPLIGVNNEKSEVTAVVTATNGFPVADGAIVNFDTTLGIISPTATISTSGGKAWVYLISGPVTGTAVISVSAGAEGIETTTAVDISNQVSTLDVAAIRARAKPPNIDTGGDTSLVTAMITATNGFPIADGVIVDFETTFGIISPTTTTTKNGLAETLFTSGSMTGTAYVSVTVGEETVETSIEVGISDMLLQYLPIIMKN